VGLAAWGGEAQARSRFGIEVDLSLVFPVDVYVDSVKVIHPTLRGDGTVNLPYIGDLTNAGGLGLGVGLIFRNLEVLLEVRAMPWSQGVLQWAGTREAVQSSTTHVNDAGNTYLKLDPAQGVEAPLQSSDSLSLVTVGAGYRMYLAEGFFEPYLPFGGGAVWTSISPAVESRFGLHLWAGAGTDLSIESLSFVFDARYHYLITPSAFGIQEGSDAAAITGETVFDALSSDLHFFDFKVGVRYSFN
jgi:hypothetical protein